MRDYKSALEFRPTLIGTISVGLTALGAPIDVAGFKEIMATLTAGSCWGTGANFGFLNVKFQESASATGTGALWSDIEDGKINGTMAFAQIAILDATEPSMYMESIYERLDDSVRKRYIRCKATMTGTDSCSPKICVNILLGRPSDSLYIQAPTTQATVNSQFTLSR